MLKNSYILGTIKWQRVDSLSQQHIFEFSNCLLRGNLMLMYCDLWPKESKIEQQTGLLLATLQYVRHALLKGLATAICENISIPNLYSCSGQCRSIACLEKLIFHIFSVSYFKNLPKSEKLHYTTDITVATALQQQF